MEEYLEILEEPVVIMRGLMIMSKVIIELNYEVANKFLNGYYNPIIKKLNKLVSTEEYVNSLEDLPIPFNNFTISIPTTVFLKGIG